MIVNFNEDSPPFDADGIWNGLTIIISDDVRELITMFLIYNNYYML